MRAPRSLFVTIFIISLLCSCAPQTKQKWLKTFFDGVPGGDEQTRLPKGQGGSEPAKDKKASSFETAEEPSAAQKKPVPAIFRHPPYAEGQCDICHQSKSSQTLIAQPPELCFFCHDDFLKDAKTKHYPAEEGMCTACHNPHKSENEHLLVKPIPALCFDCHDREDVLSIEIHTTVEGESCISCHNPHAE
ncbi:MAG: hypothetical protein HY210_06420 [Candidatus Omnitrophica bacterium]|nr:hypothetical protein [Candidatus Omnitrophota bacterium]